MIFHVKFCTKLSFGHFSCILTIYRKKKVATGYGSLMKIYMVLKTVNLQLINYKDRTFPNITKVIFCIEESVTNSTLPQGFFKTNLCFVTYIENVYFMMDFMLDFIYLTEMASLIRLSYIF